MRGVPKSESDPARVGSQFSNYRFRSLHLSKRSGLLTQLHLWHFLRAFYAEPGRRRRKFPVEALVNPTRIVRTRNPFIPNPLPRHERFA
jgi:hypothetical protein